MNCLHYATSTSGQRDQSRATRPLANITRETLEPVWTRTEIPIEKIEKSLGVSRQAISAKAKSLGLPSRTGNQRPAQKVDNETFTRMWLAGVNTREMAEHFGYAHPSAIGHRRELLGLPPRKRSTGGKNHGGWMQTISLAQFAEMELARKMGIEQ